MDDDDDDDTRERIEFEPGMILRLASLDGLETSTTVLNLVVSVCKSSTSYFRICLGRRYGDVKPFVSMLPAIEEFWSADWVRFDDLDLEEESENDGSLGRKKKSGAR